MSVVMGMVLFAVCIKMCQNLIATAQNAAAKQSAQLTG